MHFPRSRRTLALSISAASVFFLGCPEKKAEAPASAPAATGTTGQAQTAAPVAAPAVDLKQEAASLFATRCTPCHGPQGAGDGPASAGLTPKPRNFQDEKWQAEVTDEHIEKIIQYGGAAVGRSPAMPGNPDLANKPIIQGLRAHIRTLKK